MIEGFIARDLLKNVDERGSFSELLREDWKDLLEDDRIVQFNLSSSYPSIVRAWHRHLYGQVDFFICVEGAAKICAYDDRSGSATFGELDEVVLSSERLQVVRVPGILWHGYKALETGSCRLLYGVNKLYNYSKPDEERRPWDDPTIVPKAVNGKSKDPRIGKPWDWYYSPNK